MANIKYLDPYAQFVLQKLDLQRIRNGEPKYLIRELMKQKYPEIDIPAKIPMSRPVDFYFENGTGPKRPEFKLHLNMNDFNGNQKWQLWCLERFLNNNEKDS